MRPERTATVRFCEPCVRQAKDCGSWAVRQRKLYVALVALSWIVSSWFLAHREALMIARVDSLEASLALLNGSDYDLQQLARRGAPGASETATFDAAAAERRLNHTIAEVINRQNNLQTRVGHAVAELQGLRLDLKERRRDRDSRDRGRDWDAAQRTQPRAERQDPTPPPDPAPGKDSSVVLSTSMSTAVSTAVLSTPAVVATTKVAATAKVAAIKISGTPMPTPEPTGACDAGVEVTMNGSAGVVMKVCVHHHGRFSAAMQKSPGAPLGRCDQMLRRIGSGPSRGGVAPVILIGASTAVCALYLASHHESVIVFEASPPNVAVITAGLKLNKRLARSIRLVNRSVVPVAALADKHSLVVDARREGYSLTLANSRLASWNAIAQDTGFSPETTRYDVALTDLDSQLTSAVKLLVWDCVSCMAEVITTSDALGIQKPLVDVQMLRYQPSALRAIGQNGVRMLAAVGDAGYSVFGDARAATKIGKNPPAVFGAFALLCPWHLSDYTSKLMAGRRRDDLLLVRSALDDRRLARAAFGQATVPKCT